MSDREEERRRWRTRPFHLQAGLSPWAGEAGMANGWGGRRRQVIADSPCVGPLTPSLSPRRERASDFTHLARLSASGQGFP